MALPKDEYMALKQRCAYQYTKAKKEGLIKPITKKTKCVDCGAPATMYDHRNYYKPLEVEPVCRSCNGKRGQAFPYCKEWGKTRYGLEEEGIQETGYSESCLGIDFDFIGYDEHLEYNNIFEKDEDLQILKEESIKWPRKIDEHGGCKAINYNGKIYVFGSTYNKATKKLVWDLVKNERYFREAGSDGKRTEENNHHDA